MPGPGGGSRGGGFGGGSRGGFSGGGGGFRPGGSFGGRPNHRPIHRPMVHIHRPYRGYGGGYYGRGYGCGGCSGIVFLVLLLIILFFNSIGAAFQSFFRGGESEYSEEKLQEYADACYSEAFGGKPDSYEDNIMLVFLANEECNDFYTIAWVGDNIVTDINMLFGDETTEYGNAIFSYIDTGYYAYSLDTSLASVMEAMTKAVTSLELPSSFKNVTSGDRSDSHFVNKSELSLTESTVENALDYFTEETGIPAVIVVDTIENVFGKSVAFGTLYTVLGVFAVIGVIIWVVIYKSKKKKDAKTPKSEEKTDETDDFSYWNS